MIVLFVFLTVCAFYGLAVWYISHEVRYYE